MTDYLFAYGTLAAEKSPGEVASAVKKLRCLGEGFIFGRLYDLGDYPGAKLRSEANEKVFGKIFELPADRTVLNKLDNYEGFDPARPAESLFVRKRTSINRSNRQRLNGWVYEFNGDVTGCPVIESGSYSKISATRRSATCRR